MSTRTNDESTRPIALIINTNSRRGRDEFEMAQKALRDAGLNIEAHAVEDEKASASLLKREVDANAKMVIVGGGDGTLSHAASHLVHTDVALAVLPMGTGNTFARSLGLPLDLGGAAKTIAAQHIEKIDVGKVNNQIFLNSVALGLTTEIAQALTKDIKKKLGLLAWPFVGFRVLASHRALVLKVSSQEKSFEVRTHQLLIVNGRYVAGPIAAAPDASVQDHAFDVFVLGGAKKGTLLRATWNWLRHKHIYTPENRYFTTQKLRVESPRRAINANIDGEINDQTPLEMEILPSALRVVVPWGFDAENV